MATPFKTAPSPESNPLRRVRSGRRFGRPGLPELISGSGLGLEPLSYCWLKAVSLFGLGGDGPATRRRLVGLHPAGSVRLQALEDRLLLTSAPWSTDDVYRVQHDTALSIAASGVLANDFDLDGDSLSASLDTDVSNGVLSLASGGSFSYTPDTGFTGSDSFTYLANDGTNDGNAATVTIEVTNEGPLSHDDAYRALPETELLVSIADGVLANDFDLDQDTLTATLVDAPADGTLSLAADGSFAYTPDNGFTGSDSFTYTASDGLITSSTAIVVIDVPNAVPVPLGDVYQLGHDTVLNVAAPGVLAGDHDPDGHSLSAVLVTGTANGTLSLAADGSFTYTPDAGFTGSDSFTYQAADPFAASQPVTVSLEVVNQTPEATGDEYDLVHDTILVVDVETGVLASDFDADGDTLEVVLDTDVTQGVLSLAADGSFTYTPDAGFTGSDSFTYKVSDGVAETAAVTVSLTITNTTPVAYGGEVFSTDRNTPLVVTEGGVLDDEFDAEDDPLTALLVNSTTVSGRVKTSQGWAR